ncbi:hypothetical protein AAG570_011467 [Ranatra chinensis]|uniref:Uncharacterized protein n=1 Tax=Ranatra chinensis TaxID=642074 RepID=A0ABD0YL11_9HEMI
MHHRFLGRTAGHMERDCQQGIIRRSRAQVRRSDSNLIDHTMKSHIKPSMEMKNRQEQSWGNFCRNGTRYVTTKFSSGSSQLEDGEVVLVPSTSVNSIAPSTIEEKQPPNKKILSAVSFFSVDNGNPVLLRSERPNRLNAHDGIQHMPQCKSCGLQLCAHESLIPMYMSCRQHCDLDALASVTPVTTRHL